MSLFPKPYADLVARLRVASGFVLVLAFAWFSLPDLQSLAVGLPVSLAGLLLRAWATGHLEKNIRLAESGPYAYVRNPLYLGTLLVAAGLVIASRRWLLAGSFAAVFVLIYLPVIELEEQHLSQLFSNFAAYSKRVPSLWPALRPLKSDAPFPMVPVYAKPGISGAAGLCGRRSVPGCQSILLANYSLNSSASPYSLYSEVIMCGIVGYIGNRKAVPIILDGLRRLEYRGYDSAGIAVLNGDNQLAIRRASGKLRNLEDAIRVNPHRWPVWNRPYPLGHAWASHRRERASPSRL